MANLNEYTDIPDTLPEAQAMIVKLLDEIKKSEIIFDKMTHVQQEAMSMIENARAALNAVEKPAE